MRAILMLLVLASAIAAGCATNSPATSTCPADGTGDIQTAQIRVGTNPDGSMYLTPATSSVAHCAKVQFVIKNDDTVFHDVALLNYAGDSYEHEAEPGQTVTTHHNGINYFVAKLPGSFPIVCEVQGHAAKGMKGTLVVA